MSGSDRPSRAKLVVAAIAGSVLSLGVSPSFADNAEQIAIARSAQSGATRDARPIAQVRNSSVAQSNSRQGECVGGYRWIRREVNSNLTEGENSMPIRC